MGFANNIIGGAAALIRAAIKSPNYAAGAAGWSINKDGTAEFNNVTIRGTLAGTNYIISSSGMFFYSGTPGAGNLIASIASTSGTDQFGNGYGAGFESYGAFGSAAQITSAQIGLFSGLNAVSVINTSGYFLYAPSGGPGNMVASVTQAAGTDQYGNAYLAGVTSYTGSGSFWLATSMQAGLVATYTASSAAGPWTQLSKTGAIQNDGDTHFSAVGGSHLVADTLWFALNPVSGAGRDVWNDMRPLANSFVGTIANRYPPQYKKEADGNISIAGFVQFPAAGGPNFNGVTFATLPAPYRPSFNTGHRWNINLETNVTPVGTPNCQIDTAGNIQFHNLPTSGLLGVIAAIYGQYPVSGLIAS